MTDPNFGVLESVCQLNEFNFDESSVDETNHGASDKLLHVEDFDEESRLLDEFLGIGQEEDEEETDN